MLIYSIQWCPARQLPRKTVNSLDNEFCDRYSASQNGVSYGWFSLDDVSDHASQDGFFWGQIFARRQLSPWLAKQVLAGPFFARQQFLQLIRASQNGFSMGDFCKMTMIFPHWNALNGFQCIPMGNRISQGDVFTRWQLKTADRQFAKQLSYGRFSLYDDDSSPLERIKQVSVHSSGEMLFARRWFRKQQFQWNGLSSSSEAPL